MTFPPLVRNFASLIGIISLGCSTLLPAQQEASTPVFKTTVRRVVLDVVVTGKDGTAVPGLTRDDFSVSEDGKPQKVLSFDANGFGPGLDYVPPKLPPEPVNTFVNLPPAPEKGPLYVLLYDLVNMDNPDQMETREDHSTQMVARQQLVKFIADKPEGARFAIFVWSDGLHLVQGFTSDKAQLMAAIDPHNPRLHVPKIFLMAANFGQKDSHSTIAVLNHIASYLDGLPGRKNLIWFSGAFPLTLFPSAEGADGPHYVAQTKATLDLMAHNQISIYPVDGRGVVIKDWKSPTVSNDGGAGSPAAAAPGAASPAAGSQAAASLAAHGAGSGYSLLSASYMAEDEIARATGGKAFYGTNDLKAALSDATAAGTSYYTLTYSPTNEEYNGSLRNIRVELGKKGYTLAYRRSYYGSDPDAPIVPVKSRASAAPVPPAPRKVGDTLYANMQHGAPIAHQLIFSAHLQTVGALAKGSPEQMAELATQPAYFKVRRKNAPPKPLAPIELQKYAIDYTVMAHQLQISGENAPPHLEVAAAAYDLDGNMLNAIVNNATTAPSNTSPEQQQRKAYRIEQEMDVPLAARTIRIAVRDANTDRIGAMEITLPLAPQNESAAVPVKAMPAPKAN